VSNHCGSEVASKIRQAVEAIIEGAGMEEQIPAHSSGASAAQPASTVVKEKLVHMALVRNRACRNKG
jgi:hypothetical protein